MSAPVVDNFDDVFAPVCGVGFEDGNGDSTITRGGGVLRESPAANVVNDASCSWPSIAFGDGVFVQVRKSLNEGGSYTLFQLTINGEHVGIGVANDNQADLQLFDFRQGANGVVASLPYDNAAMQWLRLRPAGGIAADYSNDGRSWVNLGETTISAPADVEVSLNAGVFVALADPGIAEFDNFNACPP
jgi:hypothetical protein